MELTKGANTALGAIGSLDAVVLGVTWDTGALDCDLCALVCGPERKVLSDEHFLFWDNGETPERDVYLRVARDAGTRDRAQVLAALADLSDGVDRIVVTLA